MFELGTDWAGGVYKVIMIFPDEYPSKVIIMMMIVMMNDYDGNDYDDIDDTDEGEDDDDDDDIDDIDDAMYDATSSTSLQIVITSLLLLYIYTILSTSLRSVGLALRYTILMCIHQVRHGDGSIDR